MDLQAIKDELVNDPLGLGLAAMNDQQATDKLLEVPASLEPGRERDRTSIDTWEVMEASDPGELVTLEADEERLYGWLVSAGTINPSAPGLRGFFGSLFPQATRPITRAALLALKSEPASRAEFLGFSGLSVGNVASARAL